MEGDKLIINRDWWSTHLPSEDWQNAAITSWYLGNGQLAAWNGHTVLDASLGQQLCAAVLSLESSIDAEVLAIGVTTVGASDKQLVYRPVFDPKATDCGCGQLRQGTNGGRIVSIHWNVAPWVHLLNQKGEKVSMRTLFEIALTQPGNDSPVELDVSSSTSSLFEADNRFETMLAFLASRNLLLGQSQAESPAAPVTPLRELETRFANLGPINWNGLADSVESPIRIPHSAWEEATERALVIPRLKSRIPRDNRILAAANAPIVGEMERALGAACPELNRFSSGGLLKS